MKIAYAATAANDLERLPLNIARRIAKKMQWFAEQDDPLSFAIRLTDPRLGTHRFRVGDYRVLVEVRNGIVQVLFVLSVRHRKDAYQL